MEKEEWEYARFAAPRNLEKDLHILSGLLAGIAADGEIKPLEIESLLAWCSAHRPALRRNPFNEIIPVIEASLSDGVIDREEKEDILWLCRRFTAPNALYDKVTSDLQQLQGVLAGIVADGVIEESELVRLQTWLEEHDHLKTAWPFDEIDSLITSIMADHTISDKEHHMLLNFCAQFWDQIPGMVLDFPMSEELLSTGVCAVMPEIEFPRRRFCFTGTPKKGTKKDLAQATIEQGGLVVGNVRKDLDYLIVGGAGSECWAFACYGRKIETAMSYRKEGLPIQLVHEFDFWDAVQDKG